MVYIVTIYLIFVEENNTKYQSHVIPGPKVALSSDESPKILYNIICIRRNNALNLEKKRQRL